MSGPRVAILGSGANGASIGADLTRAGVDILLVEQWPQHVEAMRRDGVRVEMPNETQVTPVRAINVCEVATLREQFDVVLVLMKAYDTRWACQLIEPYVKSGGVVAGVQNGMTADVIVDVMGADRSVGAVIEISSTMYVPGVIERHSPPDRSWFAVGAPDPAASDRVGEIAELLTHSGTCQIVDDIRAAKWMKLVSNCTTLVTTAIVGMPMVEAVGIPEMRDLMIRAGQEAFDAGRLQGLPALPIFGLRASDLEDAERVVELLLDTLLDGFVLPHTTTTVLQDWNKGRHSEVDDINGRVVDVLHSRGQSAPVNAAVVDLAHRIERGEIEAGPHNLAELLARSLEEVEPTSRFAVRATA